MQSKTEADISFSNHRACRDFEQENHCPEGQDRSKDMIGAGRRLRIQ